VLRREQADLDVARVTPGPGRLGGRGREQYARQRGDAACRAGHGAAVTLRHGSLLPYGSGARRARHRPAGARCSRVGGGGTPAGQRCDGSGAVRGPALPARGAFCFLSPRPAAAARGRARGRRRRGWPNRSPST
jgi:hypothetical protein